MPQTQAQLDNLKAKDPRTLSWEAPEFIQLERGKMWLPTVWIVAVVLAALCFWYYSISFMGILTALVPLSSALALTTQGKLKPKMIKVLINGQGIIVNTELHPWEELKTFWFSIQPEGTVLYLESVRKILSITSIQLGKVDPEVVRTILVDHLPESPERDEAVTDRFARWIRF